MIVNGIIVSKDKNKEILSWRRTLKKEIIKKGNGLSNVKKGNGLSNIKKYGSGPKNFKIKYYI